MAWIDEKELEDFLMEPGNLQHIDMYTDFAYVQRQLNLGSYGIADIVTIQPAIRSVHNTDYYVSVVELKKDELNAGTLMQACRYVAALHQFIGQISKIKNPIIDFEVVLVGRTVNTNDWTFLGHALKNVRVWTYELCLESGISFEEHNLSSYVILDAKAPQGFTSHFKELIEAKKISDEKRLAENERKSLPAPAAESEFAEVEPEPAANG